MREVLNKHSKAIADSTILDKLELVSKKYFIVSVHREENVDSKESLKVVVDCLRAVAKTYQMPIIVSTHPRTKKRLEALNESLDDLDIRFLKPFGFFDYNQLQKEAYCAISDSGTISEESAILGFPAVTLRTAIERPEALDKGSIALAGLDPTVLLNVINIVVSESELYQKREIPEEYKVENTSLRVLKLIVGTAKLTNKWRGLEEFSRYDW